MDDFAVRIKRRLRDTVVGKDTVTVIRDRSHLDLRRTDGGSFEVKSEFGGPRRVAECKHICSVGPRDKELMWAERV